MGSAVIAAVHAFKGLDGDVCRRCGTCADQSRCCNGQRGNGHMHELRHVCMPLLLRHARSSLYAVACILQQLLTHFPCQ